MNEVKSIIRKYTASDREHVLSLWEHHSGWGRPDEMEYEKWLSTPYGDCIVLVAENEENKQIIGQLFLTPAEIYVNGIKSKAIKLSAPIIHSDFRSAGVLKGNSIMMQIFLDGYKMAQGWGYEWIYNFPAPGWVRIINSIHNFGLNRWKVQLYSCLEVAENDVHTGKYKLRILDHFPVSVQAVWENFRQDHRELSFITRDIRWLEYKWGEDLKLGIYNHSESLQGYAVIRPNSGLLLDFVLDDPDEIPGVFCLLKEFYGTFPTGVQNNTGQKFKFMLNSYFSACLKDLKTIPVDYNFVFGISSYTSSDAIEAIDFEKWYVFPND
jgi:hypothetical protein